MLRVGLLLLPGYSFAEAALLHEMFCDAVQIGCDDIVQLVMAGGEVRFSNGELGAPLPLADAPEVDLLVVFGGEQPSGGRAGEVSRHVLSTALARAGEVMVIGAAHFALARAGFLSGLTLALPWHAAQRYLAQNPDHRYTDRLFARSGKWWSVAGSLALIDAALAWLAVRFGGEAANALAARWMLGRPRTSEEHQPVPLGAAAGTAVDPKVTRTVALMEANLEEPLTTDQIAERIGVSRRQLERLFKRDLEAVPSQYYLELRLSRARQLLRATRQSIVQIGLACGFASGPHFSSAYRNRFGLTPREDRLRGTENNAARLAAAEHGDD